MPTLKLKTGRRLNLSENLQRADIDIKVGDVLCIRQSDPFVTKINANGEGLASLVSLLVKVIIKPMGSPYQLRVEALHEGGGWVRGSHFSIEAEAVLHNYGPVWEDK
jgi:hypothetical protein